MEEIRRDGNKVVVAVEIDELRAIAATLLEALEGGYALPADVWDELVGVPRAEVRAVLGDVSALLDR